MTVQQAIAIAHRARGFTQHLHAQGLIGRGNEVRMEIADALNTLLDQHQYAASRRENTR